jgi:GT2 family glycosyltransferase
LSLQLSVIIVNYNVKYFLEQCLCSVESAITSLHAEVIVVDNHSADGSIAYLQERFPFVQFIANKENVGFGKANNQGLAIAKGDYVLYLNPDTLVPEYCFTKCISIFEKNNDCGALGIRMLDGCGNFLPESKRSFPTPITSFFKLVGLAKLFPKSTVFNKYALGYLDENKNHEVDVLAGAFMMVRKEMIDATKGFDEVFFMYGEDVDLSYRIQQTGYKNYYFAESAIIHFKGESTKRGSLNYVKMFYQAMSIFVTKHYKSSTATVFSVSIKIAIWIRAIIALISGLATKWGFIIIDSIIIFSCLRLVEKVWVQCVREGNHFDDKFLQIFIPGFTLLFLLSAALSGIYDNLYKPSKALLASFSAIIISLAGYSLLPEQYRFSRGVILIGGFTAGLAITLVRWFLLQLNWIKETNEEKKFQQTVIIGPLDEFNQTMSLLQQADLQERVLGRIKINGEDDQAIGHITQIESLIKNYRIKEIIFCIGHLSYHEVLQHIQTLPKGIYFKFKGKNAQSIISSDSKTTTGEALTSEGFYQIAQPYQRRMKRLLDVGFSLFVFITFPIHLLLLKKGNVVLKRACSVLLAKQTWIGYISYNQMFPALKPAYLNHTYLPNAARQKMKPENLQKLDMIYARDYDWMQDLKTIVQQYKNLGN